MKSMSIADPFFLARRALHSVVSGMASSSWGLVLDVGCGTAPYRSLFSHATYVGVEVPSGSEYGSAKGGADILYDGKRLPFSGGTFDHVICNQVLEHVFDPIPFLEELNRVLKPGGSLMITVPFVWDEHEQPYDFARYSSYGLRHLARNSGFTVVDATRTLADSSLFAQLWLAYWFKVMRRNGRPGIVGKLFLAALSVPVNLAGLAVARLLPASPDLYLDNAMILRKAGDAGND